MRAIDISSEDQPSQWLLVGERCRVRPVINVITGRFFIIPQLFLLKERREDVMDTASRIALLEARLHRLNTRKDKDNAGVCRRLDREIRNLKKMAQTK